MAAGVSRKKDLAGKDFKKFFDTYIKGQKHYKLLEFGMGIINVRNNIPLGVNHIDIVEARDWQSLFCCLKAGKMPDVIIGTCRDLYELYGMTRVEELLCNNAGKVQDVENVHDLVLDHLNRTQRIIKITTNRFTAMQLRTHQSISWLCESTRHTKYSDCVLNTTVQLPLKYELRAEMEFSNYNKDIEAGDRMEIAGRFIDDFRETVIIGRANKEQWKYLCDVRMAPDVQTDAMYIASKIKQLIEEE
jgi:hypothetical protein